MTYGFLIVVLEFLVLGINESLLVQDSVHQGNEECLQVFDGDVIMVLHYKILKKLEVL